MQEELIEMLDKMVKYFDEIPSDSYYYRETVAILDEAEKLVEKAKKSAKEPDVSQGFTFEQLADACAEAWVSDSKFEAIVLNLKNAPAAPSQPVTLTDEEIKRNWSGGACPPWGIKFARAIIAALREKEQA